MGKRLRPLTLDKPKVMVEVQGEPMLAHVLRGLKPYVTEVVIVVGYKKEAIIEYFEDSFEGLPIKYVEQVDYKGTAHAPLFAEEYIDDDFLLVYGDLFFKPVYDEILSMDADGVIMAKEVLEPQHYGVLELDEGGFLCGIQEKVPNPPSNLINAGVYFLPVEIFEACKSVPLSERGEYELTDAIMLLVDKGFKFRTVINNDWMDLGTPERLRQAEELIF